MPAAEDYGVISHHCYNSGKFRIIRRPKFNRMIWIIQESGRRQTCLQEITFCPFCGANLECEYLNSIADNKDIKNYLMDFGYGC